MRYRGLLLVLGLSRLVAMGQAVDDRGFRALPRPIRYSTTLSPPSGPRAVIVYGKDAPWTLEGARAVQKSIRDWSGVEIEVADDRTVTRDDTWLLTDAYRRVPLVVLGNAQDNRVMHALGTRYLLQSNRTWPGGDRFILRTVFEPFVADVNYLVLEASNKAGMDGAVAKFAELIETFPENASATIPRTREVSSVKDKWGLEGRSWKPPAEWAGMLERSVSELAQAYQGEPVPAGDDFAKAGLGWEIYYYTLGGIAERPGVPPTVTLDAGTQRAMAAMYLLGYRAVGGRTHRPFDHYGAMNSIVGLRCFLQAGILTEQEVNEFESCLALSAALPDEYFYEHIGSANGVINAWGGRHCMACLLLSLHTLDYVLNHCRMDEKTRAEVQRRYEGARRTTAHYVRSFRNNNDGSCLGEDTLLQVYCVLHQGLMENVRNGSLRRSADFYILTTDNIFVPGEWPVRGCYAGLAGFSSGPGGITSTMVGRGLVDAAAFYYDDPQYRWLASQENWPGPKWSVAANVLNMHLDTTGEMLEPVRYHGVSALPYDERMYGVLKDRDLLRRAQVEGRLPPEPFEKAVDRVAFRDGFDPQDAYLFLATSQDISRDYPAQNNSIARYTDLGDVWLFHNTTKNSTWARNVVSISNGKSCLPRAACTLEALANLGDVSAVASREQGVAGTDWTRTIVHWRGQYFAVLDRMEALQDDAFAFVCRWRTPHAAALESGAWTAMSSSGNALRIQAAGPVFQAAESWPCDGSARPYVLEQYKQAKLKKGQAETYQNLVFVSGDGRPDEFEARRVHAEAMLVQGQTKAGGHLALIGTRGRIPLPGFETDAVIYAVMGNRLHLAGATTLKARIEDALEELVWAEEPVNVLLDCDTGRGEIEVPGEQPVSVKLGREAPVARKPGRQSATLAQAGTLPNPAESLEALWAQSEAPAAAVPERGEDLPPAFLVKSGNATLERPLKRLPRATVTSTPPPSNQRGTRRTWNHTEDLEIVVALPESTVVSCLRLVGITKMVPMYGIGSQGYGQKHYQADDFRFSLVLSDDDFQKDVRHVETPDVTFEETPLVEVGHGTLSRLPTWRLAVGARAKQIKLLPRATTEERAALHLTDIEAYGERADELAVQALAADINGDGSNELVVGTSEKELAAYDADGKRLWQKTYFPGDIYTMASADLDEDGKAETLVYLTSDELHRINGDGSERPVGDVYQAQLDAFDQRAGFGSVTTIGAWGPDGVNKKEVVMWAEPLFRVLPDGKVVVESGKIHHPQGVGRLVSLYPNEPEVLVTVNRYGVALWSTRRDEDDNYIRLGSKPVAGPDSGENRGLGWVQQVDVPGFQGFLTAVEGGLNAYPIAAFLPDGKEGGWGFNTGGVPAVAALAEDIDGDGTPEVFLARQDGFVNVFRLADGAPLALLNTGEPILAVAMPRGKDGKPCLAVGTKFGVHRFGRDWTSKGRIALELVAFAGPGGKNRDRVYTVDRRGKVRVLTLK